MTKWIPIWVFEAFFGLAFALCFLQGMQWAFQPFMRVEDIPNIQGTFSLSFLCVIGLAVCRAQSVRK